MKVSIIDWIIKKLKRCLAIVEDGDTASQTIAAGKYVCWKGNMCTADSQISSGTTLATSGGGKNLTALTEGVANALNGKIANITIHDVSQSPATDWDIAIENYVDSLPNDSKCHIGFVQRSGAGVLMCIIQKYVDANYSSCIAFGYWRGPYFYWKDNGTWTAKKLSFN